MFEVCEDAEYFDCDYEPLAFWTPPYASVVMTATVADEFFAFHVPLSSAYAATSLDFTVLGDLAETIVGMVGNVADLMVSHPVLLLGVGLGLIALGVSGGQTNRGFYYDRFNFATVTSSGRQIFDEGFDVQYGFSAQSFYRNEPYLSVVSDYYYLSNNDLCPPASLSNGSDDIYNSLLLGRLWISKDDRAYADILDQALEGLNFVQNTLARVNVQLWLRPVFFDGANSYFGEWTVYQFESSSSYSGTTEDGGISEDGRLDSQSDNSNVTNSTGIGQTVEDAGSSASSPNIVDVDLSDVPAVVGQFTESLTAFGGLFAAFFSFLPPWVTFMFIAALSILEYPNGEVQCRFYSTALPDPQPENPYEIDHPMQKNPFNGEYVRSDVPDGIDFRRLEYSEADLARSKENSVLRSKQSIFTFARAAQWEYFITLTFSPDAVDRYDYDVCLNKVRQWLNNQRKRYAPDLQYLFVPERHKDGAWHFHGLVAQCGAIKFSDSGHKDGKNIIYNLGGWKYGFSTVTAVRDYHRCARYIGKYVTKELECIDLGRHRYIRSLNLSMPNISLMMVDSEADLVETASKLAESMGKKIARVSQTRANELDLQAGYVGAKVESVFAPIDQVGQFNPSMIGAEWRFFNMFEVCEDAEYFDCDYEPLAFWTPPYASVVMTATVADEFFAFHVPLSSAYAATSLDFTVLGDLAETIVGMVGNVADLMVSHPVLLLGVGLGLIALGVSGGQTNRGFYYDRFNFATVTSSGRQIFDEGFDVQYGFSAQSFYRNEPYLSVVSDYYYLSNNDLCPPASLSNGSDDIYNSLLLGRLWISKDDRAYADILDQALEGLNFVQNTLARVNVQLWLRPVFFDGANSYFGEWTVYQFESSSSYSGTTEDGGISEDGRLDSQSDNSNVTNSTGIGQTVEDAGSSASSPNIVDVDLSDVPAVVGQFTESLTAFGGLFAAFFSFLPPWVTFMFIAALSILEYPNGEVQCRFYSTALPDPQPENPYEIDHPMQKNPFNGEYVRSDVPDGIDFRRLEYSEADLARSKENSVLRSKQSIFTFARAAQWEYFITLTFSPDAVDRYDYDVCLNKVRQWLNNQRKRYAPDLQYLFVPERHKDGAWHFHGLVAQCGAIKFSDSGHKDGKNIIYNLGGWKYGFSTVTAVRDYHRCARYIGKYVTKELECIDLGRHRYIRSLNLSMPNISLMMVDSEADLVETASKLAESMGKKIARVSQTRANELDLQAGYVGAKVESVFAPIDQVGQFNPSMIGAEWRFFNMFEVCEDAEYFDCDYEPLAFWTPPYASVVMTATVADEFFAFHVPLSSAYAATSLDFTVLGDLAETIVGMVGNVADLMVSHPVLLLGVGLGLIALGVSGGQTNRGFYYDRFNFATVTSSGRQIFDEGFDVQYGFSAQSFYRNEPYLSVVSDYYYLSNNDLCPPASLSNGSDDIYNSLLLGRLWISKDDRAYADILDQALEGLNFVQNTLARVNVQLWLRPVFFDGANSYFGEWTVYQFESSSSYSGTTEDGGISEDGRLDSQSDNSNVTNSTGIGQTVEDAGSSASSPNIVDVDLSDVPAVVGQFTESLTAFGGLFAAFFSFLPPWVTFMFIAALSILEYPNGEVQCRFYSTALPDPQPENPYEIDHPMQKNPFNGEYVRSDVPDGIDFRRLEYSEADLARSKENSVLRSKQSIFTFARAAQWEYFITLTFSPDAVDRYDYDVCLNKVRQWLNNQRKRYAPDLQYLFVPERHKDGAWHFHGLVAQCGAIKFSDSGHKDGKNIIYNLGGWKYGFSTVTAVRDYHRCARYIGKYVTKELECIDLGRHRYIRSLNLSMPNISLMMVDSEADLVETASKLAESMGKKIARVSQTRANELDLQAGYVGAKVESVFAPIDQVGQFNPSMIGAEWRFFNMFEVCEDAEYFDCDYEPLAFWTPPYASVVMTATVADEFFAFHVPLSSAYAATSLDFTVLGDLAETIVGMVGNVADLMVSHPVLLLGVGLGLIGTAVGIVRSFALRKH
ncbi:unnamed protein product [Cylicocyclus nassatus]|uniref:Replication-associated protein ORF2/G2P domain-containing protein n=1 Tax=Cylicocyclus nassatus TaxID=53992 RepID=A0AA36GZ13_CYLNA|nr:unnamed protein product [Cylicocyclus nassatus]